MEIMCLFVCNQNFTTHKHHNSRSYLHYILNDFWKVII